MSRAVLKYMVAEQSGSILNDASVAGTNGLGDARYVASKGAVIARIKHTALTHCNDSIRCNVICPGAIVIPMSEANSPGEGLDLDFFGIMNKHSDTSVGSSYPEKMACINLFFATDESKNITGQTLVTD